ncbi:CT620/CT621 family type III secretion system effector [Chlamydia buteonis]|uniref:Effector from type III secretion system family protein n=1 Tax=Chlamydia buteonis TaxID=2494525 RepID=A0ABX8LBD8_9CHLA|nr:CT620/CT621 family type III secretion system effector [Chlamydia buteonis]QXE26637.1 effector from type III secretion system family protein [Chlamydia buteonis]QXE27568.1 effector from type III secretion system family protein [Chlamydia buteonis]
MSSFYIQNRPKTVSGDGLFNIKLNHKFSNFNPKAQPAIDIETLNSGLYALKRLASIIEAGNIQASMLLNPNNTIFPSPPIAPKPRSVNARGSAKNTEETIAGIQGTTASALVPLILDGLQTFIDSTPDVHLEQMPSVILAIVLIKPLKDKPSLSQEEQQKVFNNCYQPQKKDILAQIKKEQASEIKKGQDILSEKLTSAGATQEEIQKALKEYEDKFTSDFFDAHVKKQLMTYRSTIGGATSKMMNDIKALAVSVPKPNKDNVNSVNGMVMLHAIFNGLTDAVNKEPALGGEEEVIKTQLTLSGYLSKESLTEEDLQVIYTASQLPSKTTLDMYLKPRDAAIYRENITAAYQAAVQNLTSVRSDIENEKQTLENQLATFQQAVSCFTSWVNGAKTISGAKEYTSEIITGAMEASAGLNSLSQMQANLKDDEKQIFNTHIPNYLNLTIGNGTNVTKFIAKIDSFQAISEYTLNNAVTSEVTVKTVLQNKADAIKKNPFYSEVSQQIKTIANSLSNYIQANGSYQIPKFDAFVQQELKPDTTSTNGFSEQAATVLQNFKTAADAHMTQLQQQIAALDKQYTDLNPADASFTDERKVAVESWLNSESLGSAFIYLILHSQLPKQSAFLNPLIEEINFNNLAANAINDLLKITNHFSTSSVYYNLSSYLIQSKEGKDLFSGDYFETCLALSREKEYIARDTDRCRRAQAFVNSLLDKIKKLPGISSSQQSEMLDATSNYMYLLSITFNQLNVLNALLSNLQITPEKKGDAYKKTVFKITGPKDWIPTLAALEGFISNGFPHSSPTGGLGPLFTQIQSDQQNYTTQGQTQQLNLQNQMTNVQQEWTLVSTSMQVLNQILSKLVGEIYPN